LKSYTASLALPKMLTLDIVGANSTLLSLNRIIENSRDVGVKLPKGVLQQVEGKE
jgi:hypothetical protein